MSFFPSCDWVFFFFQCCCYRYLREDKPHGSAGGLYNFRDRIMEDNPVAIFSSIPYFMHLSVQWNKQKCQIWCGHHFSPFKFLTKFWFWSGYWTLMLLSLLLLASQSHIFLLNCDVCCSFPLPDMLGKSLLCFLLYCVIFLNHVVVFSLFDHTIKLISLPDLQIILKSLYYPLKNTHTSVRIYHSINFSWFLVHLAIDCVLFPSWLQRPIRDTVEWEPF